MCALSFIFDSVTPHRNVKLATHFQFTPLSRCLITTLSTSWRQGSNINQLSTFLANVMSSIPFLLFNNTLSYQLQGSGFKLSKKYARDFLVTKHSSFPICSRKTTKLSLYKDYDYHQLHVLIIFLSDIS